MAFGGYVVGNGGSRVVGEKVRLLARARVVSWGVVSVYCATADQAARAFYMKFTQSNLPSHVLLAVSLLCASGMSMADDTTATTTPVAAVAAEPATAVEKIQAFYKSYFDYYKQSNDTSDEQGIPPPEVEQSDAFKAEVKQSDELCAQYDDGVCGWGADADPYLDSQDPDVELTYENSAIAITETEPNTVQVKLNVNPSLAEGNTRTILYKMVQEHDKWLVDDIVYADEGGNISTRAQLAEERKFIAGEVKK